MKSKSKSLRNKLVKSFLTFILIPNILLSVLMLVLSMYFIHQNTVQVIDSGNRTMLDSLENTIESISSLSSYPALDQDIMDVLRKDYNDYGSGALWEKINDTQEMQKALSMQIFHMNSAIYSVYLLPENSEYIYYITPGNSYNPDYNIREAEWYRQILADNGKISVIGYHSLVGLGSNTQCFTVGRCLIDSMNQDKLLGVLFINISIDQITKNWENNQFSPESFAVLIDENDRVISDKETDLPNSEQLKLSGEYVKHEGDNFIYYSPTKKQYYLSINSEENSFGWRVATLIPIGQLFSPGAILFIVLITMVTLVLTTLIFLSNRTASRITKPIDDLKATIGKVEHGDLAAQAIESDDEIGSLAKSFNHMTRRLHGLIQKIKLEQKEKHNAELLALQSQINPHFLYNTLNSIKFMAQIQGASSVSRTLDSLVNFLRFCSKNNEEVISLKEELQITEKYVEIMNIRYMDCIHYRVMVPEELLENATIRFMLQPVIENIILHGFDSDLEERFILVRAMVRDNTLFIQVADNGKGIPEESIRQMLHKNFEKKQRTSTSIGLSNINQRIKFSFGQEYGLSIRSKEKFYTVVEIHLPILTKEEWRNHDTENPNR